MMRLNFRAVTPARGYRAFVTKRHDGDSFWMMYDAGCGGRMEPELRLDGVHAPEIHPMQPGGQETTDFVNGWLDSMAARTPARRWPFYIEIVLTRAFEPDLQMTFDRYVATVWPYDVAGPWVPGQVDHALSLNYAVDAFLAAHPEWGAGD